MTDFYKTKDYKKAFINIKMKEFKIAYRLLKQGIKHPIGKRFILLNNKYPKNYKDIRDLKQISYVTKNIEGELAQLVLNIVVNKKEVNKFLEYERDLEISILNNTIENALDIIKNIEDNLGVSYWLIENKFSLLQKFKGIEGNWDYLKLLNLELEDGLSKIVCKYYSLKSESDSSLLQYFKELKKLLDKLSSSDVEYICFKMGYIFSTEYRNLNSLVIREHHNTLIDNYLFLIELLIEYGNIHGFNSVLIHDILSILKKESIFDVRLTNIERLRDTKYIVDESLHNSIKVCNQLFFSESDDLCNKCIEEINLDPTNIEYYVLLSKKTTSLNEIEQYNLNEFSKNIISNLFNIYNKTESFYDSRDKLTELYLLFPRINFFKSLVCEVYRSTKSDFDERSIKYYTSVFNLTNLHNQILNNEFESPQKYSVFYQSLLNDKNIDYDDLNKRSLYDIEEYLVRKVKKVNSDEEIELAINLIVDCYFYNNKLIARLDILSLFNYIDDNYLFEDSGNINIPIFYYINSADDYYQYVSLDNYLQNKKLESVLEIKDEKEEKYIFLLDKITIPEVLGNFYSNFKTESETIEERIKILRRLIKINPNNEKRYFEEIALLSQKNKVYETISEINKGKISFNFNRLKEDSDFNIESSYNRFLKIINYNKHDELKVVDISDYNENKLNLENDYNLNNASFVNFKSIYLEIVDKLLFSKEHGIDGDISTRIRHGVLENQLVSILKQNYLVSVKDDKNVYQDIGYWKNKMEGKNFKQNIIDDVNKIFIDFSIEVDQKINEILKDKMQIQSNLHFDKIHAMFNFRFTDEYLEAIYKEICLSKPSYEEFLNFTFELLTRHLKYVLIKISEFFTIEMNAFFFEKLNDLSFKLSDIINGTQLFIEINQCINICISQIEKELILISRWFQLTTNYSKGALDFETITNTTLEILNLNLPNNNRVLAKIDSNHRLMFNSGIYFIDILKIMIENSIKHSNLQRSDLNLKIESILNDNWEIKEGLKSTSYTITVCNNLSKDIDISDLKLVLEKIKKEWHNQLENVNSEGGSGYQKIKRILKYDIKCIYSHFDYIIEKNVIKVSLTIKDYIDI